MKAAALAVVALFFILITVSPFFTNKEEKKATPIISHKSIEAKVINFKTIKELRTSIHLEVAETEGLENVISQASLVEIERFSKKETVFQTLSLSYLKGSGSILVSFDRKFPVDYDFRQLRVMVDINLRFENGKNTTKRLIFPIHYKIQQYNTTKNEK